MAPVRRLIERGVERFLYVYDFGDDWRHDIFIESVGDGEAGVNYPALVAGERRRPPEDVVGVPGSMEFLEAALVRSTWSTTRWFRCSANMSRPP